MGVADRSRWGLSSVIGDCGAHLVMWIVGGSGGGGDGDNRCGGIYCLVRHCSHAHVKDTLVYNVWVRMLGLLLATQHFGELPRVYVVALASVRDSSETPPMIPWGRIGE